VEASDFRPIPPGTPRVKADQSWWAGPFFITGVFLLAGVAAGVRMQASLRMLAGLAGLALAWSCASRIARPASTALFWGGLFLAWSLRAMGPGAWVPGLAMSSAGALAYLLRSRPK
jgi:hypothetical protein